MLPPRIKASTTNGTDTQNENPFELTLDSRRTQTHIGYWFIGNLFIPNTVIEHTNIDVALKSACLANGMVRPNGKKCAEQCHTLLLHCAHVDGRIAIANCERLRRRPIRRRFCDSNFKFLRSAFGRIPEWLESFNRPVETIPPVNTFPGLTSMCSYCDGRDVMSTGIKTVISVLPKR